MRLERQKNLGQRQRLPVHLLLGVSNGEEHVSESMREHDGILHSQTTRGVHRRSVVREVPRGSNVVVPRLPLEVRAFDHEIDQENEAQRQTRTIGDSTTILEQLRDRGDRPHLLRLGYHQRVRLQIRRASWEKSRRHMRSRFGDAIPLSSVEVEPSHLGLDRDLRGFLLHGESEDRSTEVLQHRK